VNLLPLSPEENISAILPLREYESGKFVFMATSNGTVKKVELESFSRPRSSGLIAIELDDGNRLVGVSITDGEQDIMLLTSEGKAIRFAEKDVRAMGRTARGVRGVNLPEGGSLISLIIPEAGHQVLTASENGYGKRTAVEDFPTKGRGGKGMIAMRCSERNGALIGAKQVCETDEIVLISDQGTLVRTRVSEVSIQGRDTQGVMLIRIASDEKLVGLERIAELEGAVEELEDDSEVIDMESSDVIQQDGSSTDSTGDNDAVGDDQNDQGEDS
jgi:DNA gyrase subunit A